MQITTSLNDWLKATPSPWFIGEIVILPGYELRHCDDLEREDRDLTSLPTLPSLRNLIKYDEAGEFRPLRGAPNLKKNWRMGPLSLPQMIEAIHIIYPASLAFALADNKGELEKTEFSETAQRQTGMYRITQIATTDQIERTVREVCESGCLKQRLWKPLSPLADLIPSKLPLLCPEACNYFIAKIRETIVADREA